MIGTPGVLGNHLRKDFILSKFIERIYNVTSPLTGNGTDVPGKRCILSGYIDRRPAFNRFPRERLSKQEKIEGRSLLPKLCSPKLRASS